MRAHNPHFLKRYIKFIEFNHNNEVEGYYEIHHICPKASDLFPEYKNLSEHSWNSIKLSARQHFVAHWLLWKAYGGSQTYAFHRMVYGQQNTNKSRDFEKLRIQMGKLLSEQMKGNQYAKGFVQSESTKELRNKALRGQKRTQEQNENKSKAQRGQPKSQQHKDLMKGNKNGSANKHLTWCYDPVTLRNYRVKEIPEGYIKGMRR